VSYIIFLIDHRTDELRQNGVEPTMKINLRVAAWISRLYPEPWAR